MIYTESKLIIKCFLFLFLLVFSVQINAANSSLLLDSANSAYAQKDFSKAIALYEKILFQNFEAPELYYNLGNAYFKNKNIPMAILNYERAKKLKPDDGDIDFNLKIASSQITDKIEVPQPNFFTLWKMRFLHLLSEKWWSACSVLAFIAFLTFFLIYFFSRQIGIRKIMFFSSLLFLTVCAMSFFAAQSKYSALQNHKEAVIMQPSVTAKGSPDEKGTDLFILHEGTKIILIQNNGAWSEVKLSNGNTGWLQQSAFIVI